MTTGITGALLGFAWVTCAVVTFVAALRARRSARARRMARSALGVLYVVFGAVVNATLLATGTDYGAFADASPIPWVRESWALLVAPHQLLWISLLIVFEAALGLLVVSGGRRTVVALAGMIGFHLALMTFGWGFWVWCVPMLVALALLLRAELENRDQGPRPASLRPLTPAVPPAKAGG